MKKQVYELRMQGLSFGQIARQLGISKSTAFGYFKEYGLTLKSQDSKPVQNSSVLDLNDRTERTEHPLIIKKQSEIKGATLKEIVADDLVKVEFDSLDFSGKFLELIGKPSRIFSGIIWGLPKGGKSNLSIRFADYLQEYFGDVVYIAAEEGVSASLKEKFIQIKGGGVTVVECRNREEIREYLKNKPFQFVFIDSINVAGIDNEYLELIKAENPKKSFVSIVQATKSGNFKGDQGLTHNCDFVIKVIGGIAYHHGRFGPSSEINIFEGELYSKNNEKRLVQPEDKTSTKANETEPIKRPVTPNVAVEKKPAMPQINFNLPLFQETPEERAIRLENARLRKLKEDTERRRQEEENRRTNQEALKVGLKVTAGIVIFKGILSLFEPKPPNK
jgi:hypothetical protein